MFWLGVIWFVMAYAVVSASMTKFHHYILPAVPGLGIVVGGFLDRLWSDRRRVTAAAPAALLGLPLLLLVAADLTRARNAAQLFLWLFSYDYVHSKTGRAWPEALDFRPWIIGLTVLLALCTVALALPPHAARGPAGPGRHGRALHLVPARRVHAGVAPYWSQKAVIARYYKNGAVPEERLVAFQMFWRGESFYTNNEIYTGSPEGRTVFLGDKNQENLQAYLGRNRGKRVFFIVEKTRWTTLEGLIPADARPSLRILDDASNKFYLGSAQL